MPPWRYTRSWERAEARVTPRQQHGPAAIPPPPPLSQTTWVPTSKTPTSCPGQPKEKNFYTQNTLGIFLDGVGCSPAKTQLPRDQGCQQHLASPPALLVGFPCPELVFVSRARALGFCTGWAQHHRQPFLQTQVVLAREEGQDENTELDCCASEKPCLDTQ